MKDITQHINKAMSEDVLWRVNQFYTIIERLPEKGYTVSYWEGEENWAIVHLNNNIVAYLWQKYPLLFVNSSYLNNLRFFFDDYNFIVIVESENFNKPEFTITEKNLDKEIDGRINFESFSVEDLWFETNSR